MYLKRFIYIRLLQITGEMAMLEKRWETECGEIIRVRSQERAYLEIHPKRVNIYTAIKSHVRITQTQNQGQATNTRFGSGLEFQKDVGGVILVFKEPRISFEVFSC